jgi:predicted Co/Zn/Cd cation transporter (cation efflux family)
MTPEELKQKVEKAMKSGSKISIVDSFNKVTRQGKAEKFINENANNLSSENQEKLKKVLVNFQDFLAKNGAELV